MNCIIPETATRDALKHIALPIRSKSSRSRLDMAIIVAMTINMKCTLGSMVHILNWYPGGKVLVTIGMYHVITNVKNTHPQNHEMYGLV